MLDQPLLPPESPPADRRYWPGRARLFFIADLWRIALFWVVYWLVYFVFWILARITRLPVWEVLSWLNDDNFQMGCGALCGLFLIRGFFRRRRAAIVWQRELDGVEADLRNGDNQGAAGRLDELCIQSKRREDYHALFVMLRAVAFLRMGRPERALPLFAAVLRSGWLTRRRLARFYPVALTNISTLYAVQGALEAAEQWENWAHDATPPEASALLLPMHTLVGIRRGRYDAVLTDAGCEWSAAERMFSPLEMNWLRILCAYAADMAPASSKHHGRTAAYIEGLKDFLPGSCDFLAVKWPEFQRFLDAQGLSEAHARDGSARTNAAAVKAPPVSYDTPPGNRPSLP